MQEPFSPFVDIVEYRRCGTQYAACASGRTNAHEGGEFYESCYLEKPEMFKRPFKDDFRHQIKDIIRFSGKALVFFKGFCYYLKRC